MTTYDFKDGNGPVPAHQHPNGGGWVAESATVDLLAFVGPDAKVSGNALVSYYAVVSDNAQVADNAKVYDNALVSDNARVYDNAEVSGNAQVSGSAKVTKTPVRIPRSDGYDFIIVPCADNVDRIIAGCRYFTYEEAYNYWNKEHKMYAETTIILEALKKLYELQKTSKEGEM